MALNLNGSLVDYLKSNVDKKFTATEIAQWIFKTYPNECREKQERSAAIINKLDTDHALIQQLSAEIGARRIGLQKKDPNLRTTDERPRKYYYSSVLDENELNTELQINNTDSSDSSDNKKPAERALYPLLYNFMHNEYGIYSKRINESKSSNKGGKGYNEWLHPDLVGIEYLSGDWHADVKDLAQMMGGQKTKLYSFEVKTEISTSNIREYYFQAVSNSSWANYGYLVAASIKGGDQVEKEMRILSDLHGIGFIKLDTKNTENTDNSSIIIPAKERINVDWSAANRLAKENPDFLDYINYVRKIYIMKNFDGRDWAWDSKDK